MLAKRLLSSVVMPNASGPFVPFSSGIYANRQVARGAAVNLSRVTWDAAGGTLTYGPTIARTGMTRALYGLPARSSLNKVALFGRDFIAAPVPATANPSSDYPAPDGPALPYALSQLSSGTTTATGTLQSTAQGSAYAAGPAITIVAAADTMRFFASPTDISQFNAMVAAGPNPHTVAVTGRSNVPGPTVKYGGVVPANGFTPTSTNNTDVATALVVDGKTVDLSSYPATSWFNQLPGSETFNGSSTSGPHTMSWTYTSQWTAINIFQYAGASKGKQVLSWTSDPTRGVATSTAWNLVVGSTTESATYSLTLPNAPAVVNDDPVTLGLYDVSTIVSASPSTTVDATAYYGETYDTYEGYTAIAPANASGGVQPKLPTDGTTASVPWFSAGPDSGKSAKFTLPTGRIVKASSLVARDFATASGFARYAQTSANVTATAAATANVVPAVTDTCGSRLVTATYNSSAATYSFAVEDLGAKATYSLAVAATAYVNTGDAVLWYTRDATQAALFPTVLSATQPTDAFSQQGTTAGSITYALDPTLLYTPTSVPFLWTLDPTPQPIGLSGLPGNGLDPLYDAPRDALNVGRSVALTATAPFYLGTRAGVSYFAVSGKSTWCELVPISTVGSLQEATQVWNGSVVKRVGVKHTTRTFAGLVGVQGSVATVYPVSGTTGTSWYDVGQVIDGNGNPTGTYVSWSKPGQAWTRATVALGGSTPYGTAIALTCLYSAANKDWVIGNTSSGTAQLDLSATAQTPGAAANVHSVALPSGTSLYAVVPHASGLLASDDAATPSWYMSVDAGATWQSIKVMGTPLTGGGGGVPSSWPGQPLWAY